MFQRGFKPLMNYYTFNLQGNPDGQDFKFRSGVSPMLNYTGWLFDTNSWSQMVYERYGNHKVKTRHLSAKQFSHKFCLQENRHSLASSKVVLNECITGLHNYSGVSEAVHVCAKCLNYAIIQ